MLVILVGLLTVVVKIGTMQNVKAMADGVLSIPLKILFAESSPFQRFFEALVFAGAGRFGNLFYAYYLRDKGMGKQFPILKVDIRGKHERSDETGYSFPDTTGNNRRFQAWYRFVRYDTCVVSASTSLVTLHLFMFAAFVALHPQEQGFAGNHLIWSLSGILGCAMGDSGIICFS